MLTMDQLITALIASATLILGSAGAYLVAWFKSKEKKLNIMNEADEVQRAKILDIVIPEPVTKVILAPALQLAVRKLFTTGEVDADDLYLALIAVLVEIKPQDYDDIVKIFSSNVYATNSNFITRNTSLVKSILSKFTDIIL